MDLQGLREQFVNRGLSETDMHRDPFKQFRSWFDVAVAAKIHLPEAMTLATCAADGMPSARMVLLRALDAAGFVFFTNYRSRKSHEIDVNPQASLVFFWSELERQVRVEGHVVRTSAAESDAYFKTRPRGSQLGAWASPQSEVIASREELESRVADLDAIHADAVVPRPPFWGGYRVLPRAIEFWQGRPNRLHDRFLYQLQEGSDWVLCRLAP